MPIATAKPPAATAIRPFAKIEFPEAELKALRARIEATRWPEKELVKPVERQETKDQSQGVQLATMQKLARYWATEYDCRTSSPRSTGWTFISSMCVPSMTLRCRSSSPTDGPARSSSS